jgi:tetratricopeptide (TPR) repeat protein
MDSRHHARIKTLSGLLLALILSGCCLTTYSQTRLRKVSGNSSEELFKAGQSAQEQGRLEEAIQVYNRVIASASTTPAIAAVANLKVGNVYMSQRKFDKAHLAFQRAVTLNPASAEAFNNLGEALGELKEYTRAIEALNKAVALDNKLLKARYNMAVTYERMGNRKYSEFVFRNLIKNNPDYPLAYDGLAVTLSKSGRAKEAIAFHEKAIALNPKDPSYYYNLAISYLILGDTPKALEQQQKLSRIDPETANHLASMIIKRKM